MDLIYFQPHLKGSHSILFLSTIVLLPSILFLRLLYHYFFFSPICKPRLVTNLTEVNPLLARGANLTAHLLSRSLPNQRLVFAFNINNPFTTTSPSYHKLFLTRLHPLLNPSQSSWDSLNLHIRNNLQNILEPNTHSLKLSPFIREFVLSTTIHILFPYHDVSDIDRSSIATLADTIHHTWVLSKTPGAVDAACRAQLSAAVSAVFPNHPEEENPLNLILPAYETLWRVVLRMWVEVRFRSSGKGWKEVLRRYQNMPSGEIFTKYHEGENISKASLVSVEALVKETLRLYPPTKRIYRSLPTGELVAVDVEGIQRDTDLWGEDAEEFKPERWSGEKIKTEAWLPFGRGVFSCPAGRGFAPRLVGILVAALEEVVPEDARGNGIPETGRLGNGRGDFEDLVVEW